MVRTELQTSLHRLANYLEGQLSDALRELLAESRTYEAQCLSREGIGFIEALREVCNSEEGGDE